MEQPSREALVLRIDSKLCHVEIDGERRTLPLAGKLFEGRRHEKQPLAVGDRVRVRFDEGEGAIDELLPRQTMLCRRSSSEGSARAQVVAANLTLVLVVTSVDEPPFQPELVDGVLAAATREQIPAALVITKVDRDVRGEAEGWARLYRTLGHTVLLTSTTKGHETPTALRELGDLLHKNRSVLCGLSGVGKSTLLNTVVPGLAIHIGSLNHIQQGRHTTTHTELYPLPGGGHVLDTPGVRSFLLFHTGSQETQFLFPEIAALLPECDYRNCMHLGEPGCAVQEALESGDVAPSRYASYRRMVEAAQKEEIEAASGPGQRPKGPRGRRR